MSDRFRFPEQFLAEVLHKDAREKLSDKHDNPTVFKRALVIAVDVIGGKLQNDGGNGKLTHVINGQTIEIQAIDGPENPRNSIKARIISDGFDQFFDDDSLKIYYPMQQGISIKPGEQALVLFEDPGFENGWWFGRVPEQQVANIALSSKSFDKDNANKLSNKFPDTASANSPEEDLATDSAAGEAAPGSRLTKLF